MKNLFKMMVGKGRERFRVFYFYFLLFILAFSCSKDDSAPGGGKIETGSFTEVLNENVGIQGKVLTVQGGDVDGLAIEIPQGSYKSGKDFVISTAKINSHTFGPDFNPITPMIRINNGGGYADSILTVTIPCVVPPDHFAMGFYYDEETGELEGIPVLAINDSNVVLATRHFSGKHLNEGAGNLTVRAKVWADILISSVEINKLFNETQESGFRPGVDDWEFTNYGSYIAPGGHCAGQSLTAMWYYSIRKTGLKEDPLYDRFSTLPNPIWQDNRNGYRFSSVIQKAKNWSNAGPWFNVFQATSKGKIARDSLHYMGFAYSIRLTKKPQFVYIKRDTGAHAMIIYRTGLNVLSVADPNFPSQYSHSISLSNGVFLPYESKPNADEPSVFYPRISYVAKSAIISAEGIAEQYDKMLKGDIGNGGNPDEIFPYTQLVYYNGKDWVEISDSINTDLDTIILASQCPTCNFSFNPGTLTDIYWLKNNGKERVKSINGYLKIALGLGRNVLPISIYGYHSLNAASKYLDFKLIVINRDFAELKINPNQIIGEPDKEIELSAESTSKPPDNAKYVWTFGDGTAEVINLNNNTVKHKFAKVGDYSVNVKLYDNTTGKLLGSATSIAKIVVSSAQSFNFNWLQRKSNRDWFYDINFNLSGAVEGKNGNKVEQIVGNENSKIVNVKFASIDSFLVNFTSSFSLSPLQITSTVDPKEIITYSGTPRLSWSTNNFNPPAGQATGNGTYGNSNCVGTITIKGYMDYTSTWYDDNIGAYKTTSGTNEWVLGYIQFEKY